MSRSLLFSSRRFAVGALLILAAAFSGCATASKPAAMVAVPAGPALQKHPHSVSVNVSGGAETSAVGASQISAADFATAIRESIATSGLFAKVAEPGDYKIDVAIVRLDQPMFGFNMTVQLEANWTLTRGSDGKVLWQKAIIQAHTAKAGEAFAGVKRLRLANEGAARANIQAALAQIGTIKLDSE